MDKQDLDRRFAEHKPGTEEYRTARSLIHGACGGLAFLLNDIIPEGREKSLAITHLEEVMFWAVAASDRSGR